MEKAAGPDKQELDEKITDVSRRWDGIIGKVTKRLTILEEVVICSVQYAEAFERVKTLLDSMETKVEVIKDVSSDREVMNKQDETAKVRTVINYKNYWNVSRHSKDVIFIKI